MKKRIFAGILVIIILYNMLGRGGCLWPFCFLNLREGLSSDSSSNSSSGSSDMIIKNSADISTLKANLKKGKDRLKALSKQINNNTKKISGNNSTIKNTVNRANAAQAAHTATTAS